MTSRLASRLPLGMWHLYSSLLLADRSSTKWCTMNPATVNQFLLHPKWFGGQGDKRAYNFYISGEQKRNAKPNDVKNVVDAQQNQ